MEHNKMKLTKTQLRQIIREEIQSINEGGMGRLGTDQADVLDAIVMKNKRKGPINILRIAMKDKFLAPYIKKQGISKSEMKSYIEEILMMMNYM